MCFECPMSAFSLSSKKRRVEIGCKVESRWQVSTQQTPTPTPCCKFGGSRATTSCEQGEERDPKRLRSVMVGERRLRVQFRAWMESTAVDTPASAHQLTRFSPPGQAIFWVFRSAMVHCGQFLLWPISTLANFHFGQFLLSTLANFYFSLCIHIGN